MEITLYPFQAQAVESLRQNFRSGIRKQILSAPTGSGKTEVGAYLLQEVCRRGKKAIFVVDRLPLVKQTSERLDRYEIDHGIIQGNNERAANWKKIQVATAQTLKSRGWPDELDLIIVDEAHSQYANTLLQLDRSPARVVGLTATAFSKGLGKHYEKVVSTTSTNWLIANGFLCPYVVYAPSAPDMTGVPVSKDGEWNKEQAAQRCLPIIGDCVAEYLKHAFGKKFICFGVTVAHCEELQRQFVAAGVPCGLYTHQNGEEERSEAEEEFRKPDSLLRGLISVAALAKGFDVPDVEAVIIARPLRKSLAEHIQILGRGLRSDRSNPDKVCTILDHAGNCVRFWQETQDFFETGHVELDDGSKPKAVKREATERKPSVCPHCKCVHKPRPSCPACGFTYQRRSEIAHVAGELSKVRGERKPSPAERREFYAQLVGYSIMHGKPSGWVFHRYRERFGELPPRNLPYSPMAPSPETEGWIKSRNIAYFKSKRRVS